MLVTAAWRSGGGTRGFGGWTISIPKCLQARLMADMKIAVLEVEKAMVEDVEVDDLEDAMLIASVVAEIEMEIEAIKDEYHAECG